MDEKRKRMGWFGWSVVAFAMLIAYPLSAGPYFAIGLGPPFEEVGSVFFYPLRQAVVVGPDFLINPYLSYIGWWEPTTAGIYRAIRSLNELPPIIIR